MSAEHRKLAAIMFTDMVGYSAMAHRNERLAQDLLEEHRALLRPLFAQYNGTEIKTIGDAFLVEFNSALEAAQCAIEIQRALSKRNHDVPTDRRIELKIGIHLGDVVHRDGDVYGDGVNIASRIEPLAGPGGICVSMDVERQIRNSLDAPLMKLARQELKNISVKMDLYLIVLPWNSSTGTVSGEKKKPEVASRSLAVTLLFGAILLVHVLGFGGWWFFQRSNPVSPNEDTTTADVSTADVSTADPKSIAVLPFANMSAEADNAFFADGIHEDILTRLALIRELKVVSRTTVEQYRGTTKSMRQIARELNVAYVLEGSVRRASNQVRVTGQLIRAGTDEHVWAKSYDRKLTDIFAIQGELATVIANSLQAALSPQEKTLVERRLTINPAAYDLFLKARSILSRNSSNLSRPEAEQLLLDAVTLDSDFAEAWAYLSLANVFAYFFDEDHTPERLAKAKSALEKAVKLAPDDPEVINQQGNYFYYGYRDYARAAQHYQRVLALQPNYAEAHHQIGLLYRRQGRWSSALASLRKAVELDSHNLSTLRDLGLLLRGLRLYDEMDGLCRRLVELSPDGLFDVHFQPALEHAAHGSTETTDAWIARQKPEKDEDKVKLLAVRRTCARLKGAWAEAVKLDLQSPFLDPYDVPHWLEEVAACWDFVGNKDLSTARTRAKKLVPQLKAMLKKQPANTRVYTSLAGLYSILGEKRQALECARMSLKLLPPTGDTVDGPSLSKTYSQVLAWTGDTTGSLAELARLLRTPIGANVHAVRFDPRWQPLHGDPRFEALLNDPKNNAPLTDREGNLLP